jgi:hypothetical protein
VSLCFPDVVLQRRPFARCGFAGRASALAERPFIILEPHLPFADASRAIMLAFVLATSLVPLLPQHRGATVIGSKRTVDAFGGSRDTARL